jgi:hypothetical protein
MASPFAVAGAVGAVWGLAGYALLWGYTAIVVHRSFVESAAGTVILLPIRVVLWSIHWVERAAGSPFDFSSNNWWIGALAGGVGAGLVAQLTWAGRAAARGIRSRGSGGERLAKPPESLRP